jgi:hypothetical protein
MMHDGINIKYMTLFLENLMQNPSNNSLEQLYLFLEKNHLPITDDGHFLAYKVVKDNYMDKYSGKFDNSVGQTIKCERNEVCDDPTQACSNGFHCGGFSYSGPDGSYFSPGDKIVIVKVNPKNVVSVPHDYNRGKCRVCEYTVIGEYSVYLSKNVYTNSMKVSNEYESNESLEFVYNDNNRKVKVIKDFGDYIHCRCLSGDKDPGQFRNFVKDKMENVCRN